MDGTLEVETPSGNMLMVGNANGLCGDRIKDDKDDGTCDDGYKRRRHNDTWGEMKHDENNNGYICEKK